MNTYFNLEIEGKADNWLNGWDYRKSHVVNAASGAGTGYQVRVKAVYAGNEQEPETIVPFIGLLSTLPTPSGRTFISGQTATYWDGTYLHVWYGCSSDGSPNNDDIFYTRTSDFVNWLTPVKVIDRADGIRDPTAFVEGDYVYLFCQCFDGSRHRPIRLYRIAKTADFTNSGNYTYIGAPVDTGGSGSYDENMAASACVVKIGSTYWMAYEAQSAAGVFSIGRAYTTNIEGSWTKDGQMRDPQGNVIYAPSGSSYDFVPCTFVDTDTLFIHYKRTDNTYKLRYMNGNIPNNQMTLNSSDVKPDDDYNEHVAFAHAGDINGRYTFLCAQPFGGPRIYQRSLDTVFLGGKCRTDFGDVRFTDDDGSTLLDYWMETKVDGNYAVFWVEVADDLNSQARTIYIYYGKSDASTTSNGEATFLFFDDFPGSTYDTNKWQQIGSPTITVSNGELKLQRASYSGSWSVHGLRSKTFQADEKRVIAKAKTNAFSSSCCPRIDADYYSKGQTNKAVLEGTARDLYILGDRRDVGGPLSYFFMSSGASVDTYYTIYTTRWGSSHFKGWLNGEYKGQVTSNVNDGSAYIGLFIEEWGSHETIIGTYDYIAVAKYVAPEPAHGSWGSEEVLTNAPTNDQFTLDLTGASYKGSKTLLAGKQDYKFVYECSGAESVVDISYAEIRLDYAGKNVILRATRGSGDTWTFSEQSDPNNYVTLNTGACTHSTSGKQKTFNFYVTINWNWGDSPETLGVRCYVVNNAGVSDTDDYQNVFGVEAHLTPSNLTVDDYRCNPSQVLTFSGYWYYEGTTIPPPDGDYQVKIKLAGIQKGSTYTTLVNGAFAINAPAEASVASYVYTVEASYMANAGSFPPVIVDRIKVTSYSVSDSRANINDNVNIDATLRYEYDNGAVTTGTITINGFSASHIGSGVYRITQTSSTVTAVTYNLVEGSETTYGLATVNQDGKATTVIWDRIEVYGFSTSKSRADVSSNVDYRWQLRYDYDDVIFDNTKGSVTIGGSPATWDSANSRWYTPVTLPSTPQSYEQKLGFTDNTYGLTVITGTTSQSVIADRLELWFVGFDDSRVNIGATVEVRFKVRYDYDDVPFDGSKGTISIEGGSAIWDATNGWWKRNIVQSSSVGSNLYDVTDLAFTDTTYGLTAKIGTASGSVITDRLQVQGYAVSDNRANVNENVNIDVTILYDYDDTPVTDGTITINGFTAAHQGSGVWRITRTSASVTAATYDTVAGSGNAHGITVVDQNSKSIIVIWDRIQIINGGTTKEQINQGETVTIWFQAQYEYDKIIFDNTNGILYLNNSQMSWSATSNRWEYHYNSTASGTITFMISGVSDNSYGLTAIKDPIGPQTITIAYLPFWIISSSTISELIFNSASKTISFTINGPSGTTGYTNVTIAKTLIQNIEDLQIYLDGNPINYTLTFTEYHWLIHFTYTHSTHNVLIILDSSNAYSPETVAILSSVTILIIAVLLLVYKKVRKKET